MKWNVEAELAWMGDRVLQNAMQSMVGLYLKFNKRSRMEASVEFLR